MNKRWIEIAFVVGILVLSNFLTATHYDGLSKKQIKLYKHKLDSLDKRYLGESILQLANIEKLKNYHHQDSILLAETMKIIERDRKLIEYQQNLIKKHKKYNAHESLFKLDSAYHAEHK